MILVRILAKEMFGIVATITTVIALGELFSDAGFSKYLVQKEFHSKKHYLSSVSVAFWTNAVLSMLIVIVIAIFKDEIAFLVGSQGYGLSLVIASFQIPIYGFTSVFSSILMRNFRYKELFIVRLFSVFISFIASVGFALLGFEHWSLIISSILTISFQLILTCFFSKTKITMTYSFRILKEMLSFSFLTFIDAFLSWVASFVSIMLLSHFFDLETLGLFKTSTATINGIISIFSSIFISVLFSTLTRVQNDNHKFNNIYRLYQMLAAFIIIPVSVGIFLTRDLITLIMLGSLWSEAAYIVGVLGFANGVFILMRPFPNTYIMSKGRPLYILLTQVLFLIISIPINVWAIQQSLNHYIIADAANKLILGVSTNFILWWKYKFPIGKNLIETYKYFVPASIMAGFFILFEHFLGDNIFIVVINIAISAIIYFGFSYILFKNDVTRVLRLVIKNEMTFD